MFSSEKEELIHYECLIFRTPHKHEYQNNKQIIKKTLINNFDKPKLPKNFGNFEIIRNSCAENLLMRFEKRERERQRFFLFARASRKRNIDTFGF